MTSIDFKPLRLSVGGPEKAGVGGSIPSLATIPFNNLPSQENRVKISRANTQTFSFHNFTFGAARSRKTLLCSTELVDHDH
jgi:hypothetical protein